MKTSILIYNEGIKIKPLPTKFDMKPESVVVFFQALRAKRSIMGWNK
jgi:hypothetical protein